MLDNPLSQIERTKDAYMGRPQELQKRANMTKELVDLLAMQQLKKDLDAVKRNQAMQAQGNPATIKDQMQQGLMGEYRQQAAKDMGVGPSEADTVARARQGMPQGGPRMPQGAPQQMPQAGAQQMAQGVMSQAQPVKLAGGGIVAFANGSENEGPVEVTEDQIQALQQRLGRTIDRDRAIAMIRSNPEGKSPIERLFSALSTPERTTRGERKQRSERGEEPSAEELDTGVGIAAPTGNAETLRNFDTSGLQAQVDAEYDRQGLVNPKYAPPPNVAQQQEKFEPEVTNEGIAGADAGADAGAGEGIMSLDDRLKTSLLETLERDPSQLAKERAEAVRGELGLGRGIEILEDREARARKLYEERSDPDLVRRRGLLAQLGGLASGPPGSGAKARAEYRKEQEAVRDKFETALDNIGVAEMTLRREVGDDAADAYDAVMQREMTSIANAQGTLQRMSAEERRAAQAERAAVREEASLVLQREGVIAGTYADPMKAYQAQSESTATTNEIRAQVMTELGITPISLQALQTTIGKGGKEGEEAQLEYNRLMALIDDAMQNNVLAAAERQRLAQITRDLNEATTAQQAQRQRLTGDTITVDAAGNPI